MSDFIVLIPDNFLLFYVTVDHSLFNNFGPLFILISLWIDCLIKLRIYNMLFFDIVSQRRGSSSRTTEVWFMLLLLNVFYALEVFFKNLFMLHSQEYMNS